MTGKTYLPAPQRPTDPPIFFEGVSKCSPDGNLRDTEPSSAAEHSRQHKHGADDHQRNRTDLGLALLYPSPQPLQCSVESLGRHEMG
jgi:hypothetical protein